MKGCGSNLSLAQMATTTKDMELGWWVLLPGC